MNLKFFPDLFYVNITEQRSCELRLGDKSLDHEVQPEYVLKLRLDTLANLINPSQSSTTVSITAIANTV